jgi:hypothetical protein
LNKCLAAHPKQLRGIHNLISHIMAGENSRALASTLTHSLLACGGHAQARSEGKTRHPAAHRSIHSKIAIVIFRAVPDVWLALATAGPGAGRFGRAFCRYPHPAKALTERSGKNSHSGSLPRQSTLLC